MWRDIGLDDWLLNLDAEQEIEGILPTVLAMAKMQQWQKKKALKAKKLVEKRQIKTMQVLKKYL